MATDETGGTSSAPLQDELTARWRAVARYGITKHAVGADGYSRVKTQLSEHTGLTWDEVNAVCAKLNKEAYLAAGSPSTNWGLTQFHPKLETPSPGRWTLET
jgi:hypothetical protein